MRACVLLASLGLSACTLPTNTQCSDIAEAGLTVHVVDQISGDPICDATVVVTDGSYTETLEETSPTSGCFYAGAYERPGTYDLVVSAPGHQTLTQAAIVVAQGTCHVSGRTLTIDL